MFDIRKIDEESALQLPERNVFVTQDYGMAVALLPVRNRGRASSEDGECWGPIARAFFPPCC